MSKFFKSLLLLLSAGLFTATGWAETWTATNVSIATGTDGGSYDWAQFKFVDVQNAITNEAGDSVNAEAVSEYLDVTSVAILRRSGKDDWSNTITVNLMTADGTSVLENGTSGTLTTEDVTTSSGQAVKWMVFTFETPVRINKNMIYRIKPSSGGQQYYMSNVSGKTGKNNTSILASASQDSFSPFVRIVATSVDLSEFSRTIASGENNWSESDVWQSGGMNFASPTEGTIANLSVTEEATLKMNASASVASMNISGNGSLTIATDGTNKLTADITTINADTTVNAGAASLGAVTVAGGKTLTVKDDTILNSTVTQQSGSTLVYDYESGTIPASYDYNVAGATVCFAGTQSNATFLGGTNGTVEVAKGAKITVPHLRFLNADRTSDSVTFNVAGTVNVTGVTTQPWNDRNNYKGVLLGHWHGTGTYNIDAGGFLNAENTYTQIVYTAERQTLNINGGKVKTRALKAGNANSVVNLTNNGTLELATWDNSNTITQNYGYGTVKAYAYENSTGWTNPQSVTFTDSENGTTLDANGLTIAFTGAISGSGKVIAASSEEGGTVNLSAATVTNFTGTYVVTNKATLILTLAQTANKTIAVEEEATLKVKLSALDALSAQSVTVTGDGKILFVDADGNTLAEADGESQEDNVYTPAISEYTYTVGADEPWGGETPTADAKITIDFGVTEGETVDLTTALGEITVVAELIVTGTTGGTITKSGNGSLTIGKFSPQTNVTVTGAFLRDCVTAHATITVPETKTLSISVPNGGTEWDCALKHSFAGTGIVKKVGAGSLSLEDAYTAFTCPNMVVDEGAFRMASGDAFASYANAYAITVNNGAKFMLGYNAALTGNTTITLNDGATMECKNGNHSTVSTAAIVVNGNATIKGSLYGNGTTFSGGVSGNGTLTLEEIAENGNPLTFSGVISGGLQVIISEAQSVTFSGANNYTGGTVIAAEAQLINDNGSALGNGKVTGAGTLIVNIGKHPGNHDDFGFADAANWTGTVEFTGGNFATPVEFSKWQNANSKFKVASGATVFAANGHTFAGTLMGGGTITNTLTFAEGATLDTTAGTLTASGAVNFGGTLNVKVSGDDIVGKQILKKADANIIEEVVVENVTVVVNGNEGYCLAQNAAGYVLREKVANPEVSATVPAGGTTSLSVALGGNELAANTILTINFGDGTTPGIFTFDNEDEVSFAQIIVRGTNGGRIAKSETADTVTTARATINTVVTVDAGVATFTATEIPAEGALTVADTATVSAVSGAGVLAYNGVLPANVTGLDAATWTGTLALVSTPAQEDIAFNSLGNASSTVRLQDYTGSLSNKTAATCYTPNLEIKGKNTINAATAYAIPIFQGDISGDGTIVFSSSENTNYLFSGDFSAFTGTMELTHTSPKIAIGAASNTDWNAWNPIVNNGQGNITIATAATLNGTFRAVSGVETTSSAILSGNGTIDCSLVLAANVTIDASVTLLTVTGDITLPNTLTVKVAATPTAVTPVSILTTTATPNVANTTVTVIVNEATLGSNFELVKNGDKLQVRVAPDRIAASETPDPVTEVPSAIFLDTVTFSGYGQTFTVLQYTGTGTPNWDDMSVEGLPEGAEEIKTNTTWGFAIKTLNVLTVGDSITAGLVTYHNSNANWHVPGGYRLPLYKYLTRAGYSVKYLGSSDVFGTSSVGGGNANEANPSPSLGDNDHHEGHSGITLVTMLERFNDTNVQNKIASQGTPDVITLHLGTNDIADVTGDEAILNDAEKVLTRMKNLLNRLQELYPNTKILVAKIIARSGNKNKVVTEFNKKLNTFFESNQEENLILVDLGINSVSYGLLRYDGLHPSTEGYTQMATGWFNAIEAEFDPLGDSMEAPTPATSTPMEDVNESDRTVDTVGMAGVLKAAEWTTFADFETGYLSQFGYMLDSERPWQLDVRGTNEPEVTDGVLSLNGAPITVNPVDGRLGTTKSTYTIVMKVSNLAANDVIFTDSSVRNDDWPENVNANYKGTTNADLLKMTVGNATTLKVQYKENSEQTVSLTDVDLTDATPEVIAVVVKQNAFSIFVNGTKVATDVSLGGAINESYRGSFSIGALSADNAGSAMKLYRLSFYEGEVTAIAAPIATTATINVGEGAGQYITWETAKTGLNLAEEMESLTINFTAADQTFTFDNTDVVTIDSVTVQGTAGGTIANAGTATVTATNLAINTNVTMNKCVDKNTLPIETTTDIAIAQNCVLTYYINGAMSTVTVAATHSGAGKIAKTSYGTLEITNTCAVNVDVNQGQFKVNVPINGEKKSIENQKTVKLTGSMLILTSGLSYATFDGDETSIIRVDGDYTFGISNSFTNDLDAGEIQIDAGKTLTIRNFKSGYVLSPSKLLRVNGTLQRDGSHGQDFKVSIPATSTLEGSGSITQAIELADGATVHCAATALAVNTVTFAEGTLNVTGADALANGETVTLFRTTAYAAATGLVEGVVARRAATADETNYRLYKTADAIEVWPSATDAETWTVDAATATTWADVVNQMAAANKRPADTTALTINFGDKPQDGEAVPGTFTFDGGDVTVASITVTGTNGGTIVAPNGTTVTASTSAAINTAVAVTGQIQLNGATIAADAELAITNYAVLGTQVSGAGALKITGATLSRGLDADLVSDTWTGTVILEDIDDNNLDLRYLVNDSITSADDVLTIAASSSLTIKGTVKAYIYDGAIDTLTLDGDFQMANGTTNKSYTQCVTVDNLAGAGAFIGHQSSEVYIAVNVKSWTNFTGSIDLSNEKSAGTIFFFGTAPEYFTTSITPGNVGAADSDFPEADYGTIYVTEGNLVTAVGSTWKAPKVNIANDTSLTIQGWFGASESITGLSANTIVGGVKNNEDEVVEAGVLDLRALDDLSGVNVTVKAGGRLLVNTGATVPNTILFEAGSILGVATKHVEDVGNATLTVNVDGTAATVPTIKGYHMDGVTELDNWAKNNETSSEGEFKFNFDPVFDGELCWWAYEFDNEVNTSAESNLGPISTGRDKGRMNFDGRGDSNRVCQDNEYLDHGDGTKAIRVASSPWRNVDGGYPTAFTAAMYGTLTENRNRIIMGFGSSYNQKYTIALVTGASTDEVRLVLQKGWNENNTDYPEDAVITLATTTVPNAVTENHLFAFSYEQFDSEDDDEELDSTRIIFYVDGEKYQPFTAKAIIPLGNGFQMGSIHGGWHNSLTRMNGDDVDCTMEYLRIYDQILPESVWTAMSNEYSYMSKNGRATRTIVASADTTWNEGTEWTQVRAVKDGEDYVLDAEGHVTFDNGTAVEKPDHGENVGTQVVLNVSGENTLYLNEFYSNPIQIQNGEVSKLYYERLEINPVEGGDEDSLTLWAGRLNPAIEEEDPLKNSQSAVITVQGYTKINTNVTMAHNVAFLSGPVAVAEGKWLHFDFSGFDVMKVPSMPVTYRLTGFLDEDTRKRVTSTAPADPVNARSIDLGYKTTVNQYTFTVNRYPVTAYFTADEMAGGNSTDVNFNNLNYVWQGNDLGKQMNWEAEAVDPQGNPIVENTLAKFVSLDAETQKEKMVTVTLATNDAEPITLTLEESDLSKETTPAGTDAEGNPTEAIVEPMLGEQQLIVGNNVIVDYTGNAAKLAAALNEASAETTGVIRTAGFTVGTEDGWRANLSVTGGALAGVGKISGKVTFEEGASLDASAATAEACLSAKDADLTNLKAIKVNYDAAAGKTLKVLSLPTGHTAKSLIGCTVTAVNGEGETVATWRETDNDPTKVALVVVRENGLYVTGRPVVKAGETEVTNNDLTLPLARRAAELSATSVSLTGVVNMAGESVEASVADAAEVFTNVAFDMTETPDGEGVVTAKLKYDFGVSQINVVTIGDTEYVVAELIVSNAAELANNSADYADGVTVDVVVKKGEVTQTLTMTPVADMTGAETMPATVEKAKRYIRFQMPDGNGTFEIKARAKKAAQQ